MLDNDQLIELLGSGLTSEQVATAVGCDPGHISHLLAKEDFAAKVVAKRVENLEAASKRDRQIDAMEDRLIAKLEENMEMIYKPVDILRTFAIVNRAVRRGVPAQGAVTVTNNIINLQLPTHIITHFTKNSRGEVVEVEGQTLVTMPSSQLLKNLAKTHEGKRDGNQYEKASRYISSSSSSSNSSSNSATGEQEVLPPISRAAVEG